MDNVAVQSIQKAKELLDAGNYVEAIVIIGETDISSVSPDQRAFAHLIYAECKQLLDEFDADFDSELNAAMTYYKASHNDARYAQCKYIQAVRRIRDDDHVEDAREMLLEAYVTYKRCDDLKGQGRTLNLLARINLKNGDFKAAIENVKKAINIYERLNDIHVCSIVQINLMTLYLTSGNINRAIQLSKEIYPNALKLNRPLTLINYHLQVAKAFTMKGDLELAKKSLLKANPFLSDFVKSQAFYYFRMAEINILEANLTAAKNAALEALKIEFDSSQENSLILGTKRLLARIFIEKGDEKTAFTYAQDALVLAEKINEKIEIAECKRILGVLEARDENDLKARIHFQEALEIFTQADARYDLALTQYMAATSGIYNESERQAMFYLARRYFESEEISYYLDKIDAEIKPISPTIPRSRAPKAAAPTIVTENGEVKKLLSISEQIAPSDMSVLLIGPTGTGKDLFARYIHHHSRRRGRFVPVNAAAIPESMIESELFGHCRGAFTNADRDKTGLIEVADNGTLYLNEIADASKELQAKLLDVLENHKIRRLGETRERDVAFRLIAATNHDLNELIREGRFRVDLYHRLNEMPILLPPLNERIDDIGPLLLYFFANAGISVDRKDTNFKRLVTLLSRREWSGNIRQLEAEAKRMALLSRGDTEQMVAMVSQTAPSEYDKLLELLRQAKWNRREAARKLGVSDTTIRRKIKKYNLHPNR